MTTTLARPVPVTLAPTVQPGASRRRPGRLRLNWPVATVLAVLTLSALPLLRTPDFYFWNDTAAGAVGQWYYLGDRLLAGQWPLLDPSLWRAGNFVADGQMGLYSPLIMAIGVGLRLWFAAGGSLVVFCTLLKLGLLVAGALGTYRLTRSYGVPGWAGFLAGLSVTVGGTTRYLDAASWVTGLEIWALWPWLWWSLRRMVATRGNPLPTLIFGYLLVTTGYVYGCLFVAFAVVATLVDALLARRRRPALAVVGVGVCCAVLAVTVYLPGVLTGPVTTRAGSEILSDGRMTGDLLGMLVAVLPVPQPVSYVCWFVPLIAFVKGRRAVALLRPLAGLLAVGVLASLWILGPQSMGPLRYPARLMPAYVLVVVVLLVVLLARARVARPGRGRLLLALGWTVTALWLAVARAWWYGTVAVVSAGAIMAGVAAAWWLWRAGRPDRIVAAVLALGTLLVVAIQYAWFPAPPQLNRLLPADPAGYQVQAAAARGDTIFVGNADVALSTDTALSREVLVANTWLLNPHPVQNGYSLAGYRTYVDRYCLIYNGMTCKRALSTLFSPEPSTGLRRVDLLAISSVLVYRPDFPGRTPPSGWRVAATDHYTQTWVRDQVRPGAGGVVWTSSGLAVTTVSQDANGAAIRVDRVGPAGGTVVLSRLAFPGYRASGAAIAAPIDGYLLTLRVPPGSTGQTVRVEFRPPGWTAELIALGLAGTALLIWPLLSRRLSRRAPRSASRSGSRPT